MITPLGGVPMFMAARSVFVSAGDVYVAGEARNQASVTIPGYGCNYAVLWENGEAKPLGDTNKGFPTAHSVFVSGGHVYVAGYQCHDSYDDDGRIGRQHVLWVDGVPQYLRGRETSAEATSVFVSGDDVYVGGRGSWRSFICKNGVCQELNARRITAIFVDDGDVHAVGSIGPKAALFKNGARQALCDDASALSVFVSGGDVYVGGHGFANVADGTLGRLQRELLRGAVEERRRAEAHERHERPLRLCRHRFRIRIERRCVRARARA